jgi:hypothetical protein
VSKVALVPSGLAPQRTTLLFDLCVDVENLCCEIGYLKVCCIKAVVVEITRGEREFRACWPLFLGVLILVPGRYLKRFVPGFTFLAFSFLAFLFLVFRSWASLVGALLTGALLVGALLVTSLPPISLWITGHLSEVFRPRENQVSHHT